MIQGESSLFELLDHFLARDAKRFYGLWDRMSISYDPPFWTMFLGRMLWRLACVLEVAHDPTLVRTAGRGLPSKFLQSSGWKKYSLADVAKRLDAIYHLDVACKSGATAGQMERFFAGHFGEGS